MAKEKRIEITPKTILIFFGIGLSIYFLWLTRDILVILFLSLIIMATLSPIVSWLEKYLRWRALAVIILYFLIIILTLLLFGALLPPLINQAQEIINNLPSYTEQTSWLIGLGQQVRDWWISNGFTLQNLINNLSQPSRQIFHFTSSILVMLGGLIVITVISFYGLIAEKEIKANLKQYLPKAQKKSYWQAGQRIFQMLGIWLRARILLGLLIGILVGVGLQILGLPFALFLGALAGILDIVPVWGPISASIPILIIAFALSPLTGVLVLTWLLIIYQIEGYLLVPKIMGRAVGISPVLVLVALVLGAKLDGIIGIIIAIPVAAAVVILFQEIKRFYEVSGKKSPGSR